MLPLEKLLMEEFRSRLSREEVDILNSQLDEINLVERLYEDKSIVTFNKVKGAGFSLKRERKFESDADEYKMMRVAFEIEGLQLYADFYIVFGNFFSIEINSDISSYVNLESIKVM